MNKRGPVSILFPVFVALPLALAIVVVLGVLFVYSKNHTKFLNKQYEYTKWQTDSAEAAILEVNHVKTAQGGAFFEKLTNSEMSTVRDFLTSNTGDSKGVRIISIAGTSQSSTARKYGESSQIGLQGHTGDILGLLVAAQNKFPNAEITQSDMNLDPSTGLIQVNATLSLIKIQ
jgi:hypothetical protein